MVFRFSDFCALLTKLTFFCKHILFSIFLCCLLYYTSPCFRLLQMYVQHGDESLVERHKGGRSYPLPSFFWSKPEVVVPKKKKNQKWSRGVVSRGKSSLNGVFGLENGLFVSCFLCVMLISVSF